MNRAQTNTCSDVCRFLNAFQAQADQSLSGSNLNILLQEVAVQFRSQLLDHFKKWQVSEVGGVVLARDMSRYVDLLKSWKIDDAGFGQGLEVLTELASLFVLKPEALKERMRGTGADRGLAGVGKENLRPYLLRRDDYDSVGMLTLMNSL